jgi:hypothetical protein
MIKEKENITEIEESVKNYLKRHNEILGYVERGCKPEEVTITEKISKEEKKYNHYPVDVNRLEFLNEAYSQVNNLDAIIDEVYINFTNTYNLTPASNGYLQVNGTYRMNLEGTFDLPLGSIQIGGICYKDKSKFNSKYVKGVEFALKFYFLDGKYMNYFSQFCQQKTFKEAAITTQVTSHGIASKILELNIPGVINGRNVFIHPQLAENAIRHEITHYYQKILNPAFNDPKTAEEYHTQYGNITSGLKHSDDMIRKLSFVLYFLTPSEVLANVNSLSNNLKQLGANKNNYQDVFNKTEVGERYNNVNNYIAEIFRDSTIDWDEFRKYMQSQKYFEKKSTLGSTQNGDAFKRHLQSYIQKEKKWADDKFQKSIIFAIGGYSGKRDDVQYSTHNTRIT